MMKNFKLFSLVFVLCMCTFFIGDKDVEAGSKTCTCVYSNTACSVALGTNDWHLGTINDYRYTIAFVMDDSGKVNGNQVKVTKNGETVNSKEWPEFVGETWPTEDEIKKAVTNCNTNNCPVLKRRIANTATNNCSKQVAFHTNHWFDVGWVTVGVETISATPSSSEKSSDDVVKENQKKAVKNMQEADVDVNKIKKWGKQKTKTESKQEGSCDVINSDLRDFLKDFLGIISIVGIILLLLMTAMEFVKVITSSEEDSLRTAFKHTIIRIFCAILLLLLPTIVGAVINVINKVNEDPERTISTCIDD